jgi:hypothetical protein
MKQIQLGPAMGTWLSLSAMTEGGWRSTHHWKARRRKDTGSSHDSTSYAQAAERSLTVSITTSGYPETSKTVDRLGKMTGRAGRLAGIPKGMLPREQAQTATILWRLQWQNPGFSTGL